jgi:integrase
MITVVPVAISPLRQRLIEEMELRRFGRETQRNYIRDVARFATFLGRPPDTATAEEVRRSQVEQRDLGVSVPTMNSIVSALRFFFTQVLDGPDLARKLVRTGHIRKLPVVLSQDEVARLLGATTCLKHQAALSVAYGAGLRASEVTALKVRDVDSERMLLRVERGKGGQYRGRLAAGRPAGIVAGVVEGRAATGCDAHRWLAVPRSALSQAAEHAATAPRRRRGKARLQASISASDRTPCGTALLPICSRTGSTCGSSRRCSATPGSIRPRSTPGSRPVRSAP